LRDDFGRDRDVDFLVVFKNDDYGPWMGKLTHLWRPSSLTFLAVTRMSSPRRT
jgi:hypothetical protein